MSCKCRVCNAATKVIFTGTLLKNNVEYLECQICGYVQTTTPHWLDSAYAEPINDSDTGILRRNQDNARIVLGVMFMLGNLNGTVVDCAGGYGILVRLLRDYGINALWSDPHCENLLARGFEHATEKATLVTSFEAFEHFLNPADELDRMLEMAPNVLFSTEIIPDPAPKQDDWWYYGKEHGQHVGFFRIRTLEKLARERGKFLLTNGTSYHLVTERPISNICWHLMLRGNRALPILLKHRLTSKTLLDHSFMTKLKK